jgi:hypothetical protein
VSTAERAQEAVGALSGEERRDAERVLELCRHLRPEAEGATADASKDRAALRIELSGLAERLGRRHARAIVFACIARAALAELGGAAGQGAEALAQADRLLARQGL